MSQHKNTVNSTYPRIDIRDYVTNFLQHIREKEGRMFNTNHDGEVANMKQLLNDPKYTAFKSTSILNDGIPFWHKQNVDCVPSNLGRGAVFYFICNGCNRRMKYLYRYSELESPLCRVCCRLQYEAPTRKARMFSKLLRKPYFSSEDKCLIIQRAGITLEDMYYRPNTALQA